MENQHEQQQQQQQQQQGVQNQQQQHQVHPFPQAPFHHLLQQQHQQLQMFWNYQRQEIEHAIDFKNHQLPLARIKKIMKADEDVRMISAEAPILFAKACELFILELTIRSWLHAEENKRRTLQKNDIAAAITRTDIFDFLVDIVPRDEIKEDGGGLGMGGAAVSTVPGSAAAAGVPYYYPPPAGVMMGQPAMAGIDPGMYVQRPWQPMWQPGMADEGSGFAGGGPPGLDGQGYGGGGGGGGGAQ
ncbi:putative transcription factor Hap3/NF-YB family [Dioscorea sansibarensis]